MNRATIQTLVYLASVAAGQLASFLLLPIVTAYLTPTAYGEYALALTVSGLVGVLGSSWVRNVALRLYFEARKAPATSTRGFVTTIACFQLVTVAVAYCAVLLCLRLSNQPLTSPSLLFAAGIALISGDFYVFTATLLRAEQNSLQYLCAEVALALLKLGLTAAALRAGYRTPVTLFGVVALAQTVTSLYSIWILNGLLRGPVRILPPVIRSVSALGISALPFSVGVWVMALSDRLLLAHFTTNETVGLYSAGYTIGDRVVGGIVTALFMMSWPQILKAWNDTGKAGATQAIRQSLRLFMWFTVGPLVLVVQHAPLIVTLLTSHAYAGAAGVVAPVAVGGWVYGLASYLNRSLELQKRYSLMSWITLAAAAINVVLNLMLIPRLGSVGAAIATLIAYAAALLVVVVVSDRSFVKFPAGDTVAAFASALGIAWVSSHLKLGQPVQVGLFTVLYLCCVLAALLWKSIGLICRRN